MRTNCYHALLAAEPGIPERSEDDLELDPVRPPLVKLPPGPWLSLGGYLDYTKWPDRERFIELDLAIKSRQDDRLPLRAEDRIRPPRRCRASIPDSGNCNAIVTLSENYDGWKCEVHRKPARGAKAEPGTLETFHLALLGCNPLLAQGGA